MPCGTSCSCAPSRATPSSPSPARAALAGNSAWRSGVDVKIMLTTSSGVRSLRANSSFTMRVVLASISAFESSSQVIAPRSAWSFTTSEVSRGVSWRPCHSPCQRRAAVSLPRTARAPHRAATLATPRARARDRRPVRCACARAGSPGDRSRRTCAAPGGSGPRGSRSRPPRSSHGVARRAYAAGAVMPSSSSRPSRSATSAPGAGTPSTSARYVFSTPWLGCVRSCVSSPSLVSTSKPVGVVVEASDREHAGLGRHEIEHGRCVPADRSQWSRLRGGLFSR